MTATELGRRERKKQLLRGRILEEAIALIKRDGVERATIDAICESVDIAKKTFYNYYNSKHDLLIALCQSELLNRTDELINEAMAGSNQLTVQLDRIFTEFARRNQSAQMLDRELIDYMVGSLSDNRSDGGGQLTFMNQCFLRMFQAGKNQIKPELTPAFCAEMTVGMSNAITLNWLHDKKYDTENNFLQLLTFLKDSMLQTDLRNTQTHKSTNQRTQ